MTQENKPRSNVMLGCLGILAISGVIFLLIMLFGTFAAVGVGEVGIVKEWGAINEKSPRVFNPGFNFKMPFRDDVVHFDTRVQRIDREKILAASKDGISVDTHLAVNFHIDAAAAPLILQMIGTDYANRVLAPAIEQSYKDVSGTFSALEMIQSRQRLADEAQKNLAAKVSPYHLFIDTLSVINIDFPKSFDDALQATQVANQNRLKATQEQETVRIQAETARLQAEGLAAAQKAQATTITADFLALQAIQNQAAAIAKWDGKSWPLYITGTNAMPFLGVGLGGAAK